MELIFYFTLNNLRKGEHGNLQFSDALNATNIKKYQTNDANFKVRLKIKIYPSNQTTIYRTLITHLFKTDVVQTAFIL